MQGKPTQALEAFKRLSLRERVLVIVAFIAVVLASTEFLWVHPLDVKTRAQRERITRLEAEETALAAAAKASGGGTQKASPAQVQQRDRMRASVEEAEVLVRRATAEVKMGEVARMLAANSPGVKLVSLRTLPSERFLAPAETGAAPPPSAVPSTQQAAPAMPPLYRHGIEVVLGGSYAALVPYLRSFEQAAPGIYWGAAKLDVAQHPDCTLKLTLYSFSVRPEVTFE
jgi:MSHA biogenesis protein MshJ